MPEKSYLLVPENPLKMLPEAWPDPGGKSEWLEPSTRSADLPDSRPALLGPLTRVPGQQVPALCPRTRRAPRAGTERASAPALLVAPDCPVPAVPVSVSIMKNTVGLS